MGRSDIRFIILLERHRHSRIRSELENKEKARKRKLKESWQNLEGKVKRGIRRKGRSENQKCQAKLGKVRKIYSSQGKSGISNIRKSQKQVQIHHLIKILTDI